MGYLGILFCKFHVQIFHLLAPVLVLVCICAMCLVTQLCLTLWPPWTVAHQAPLSIGILQARILERVAMPSSRGSSQPRIQPALQEDSVLSEPPGKSCVCLADSNNSTKRCRKGFWSFYMQLHASHQTSSSSYTFFNYGSFYFIDFSKINIFIFTKMFDKTLKFL